ncbi:hypothetical protein [Sulfuriflexus mobilis]|nr:hypothetical protein [Sulfuriflexus mobilis]
MSDGLENLEQLGVDEGSRVQLCRMLESIPLPSDFCRNEVERLASHLG